MIEITLDGPGKNALGTQMMDFILAELERANGAPVLITGKGDAFSAGLNLKEVASLDAPQMERFLRKLEALFSALYTYRGPTAAAVNGHAIAGGCLVALACDVRTCTTNPTARIGINEVALGLQFPPSLLRMLRQLLSPEKMTGAVLGAELHPPESALRLGFVDVLADDPMSAARQRLGALARHPADAYAAVKQALRGTTLIQPEDAPAFQALLPFWTSQALKDRIAAMFRK